MSDIPRAIGIDLGMHDACVAYMKSDFTVEIIENRDGYTSTPTVVHFGHGGIEVGEAARRNGPDSNDWNNTVKYINWIIGRPANDPQIKKMPLHCYRIVSTRKGDAAISVTPLDKNNRPTKPKTYRPEEISAFILKYLREIAQDRIGQDVRDAVITVPPNFNDAQIQATKNAGKIAGLNVLQIINEPTAAAVAYGNLLDPDKKRVVCVCDIQWSSFDVSIVRCQGQEGQLLSTAGITGLGGSDFEMCTFNNVTAKLGITASVEDSYDLYVSCKKAKDTLSVDDCATITWSVEGKQHDFNITRVYFDSIHFKLFQKLLVCIEEAIGEARVDKESIDDLVFIGWVEWFGNRSMVQIMIRDYFGNKEIIFDINAVVYGAAIIAQSILNKKEKERVGEQSAKKEEEKITLENLVAKTAFADQQHGQLYKSLIHELAVNKLRSLPAAIADLKAAGDIDRKFSTLRETVAKLQCFADLLHHSQQAKKDVASLNSSVSCTIQRTDNLIHRLKAEVQEEQDLENSTAMIADKIRELDKSVASTYGKKNLQKIIDQDFTVVEALLGSIENDSQTTKNTSRKFVHHDSSSIESLQKQFNECRKNLDTAIQKALQDEEALLLEIAIQLQKLKDDTPAHSISFETLDYLEGRMTDIDSVSTCGHLETIEKLRLKGLDTFVSEFRTKFEPINIIGLGGFGSVFEAANILDDWKYAVKRIPLQGSNMEMTKSFQEAKAMAKLEHQGIVRYHSSWVENPPSRWQRTSDVMLLKKFHVCEQDNKDTNELRNFLRYDDKAMFLYIQMEFCGSNLADWLKTDRNRDPIRTKSWFRQIVAAVAHIHKQNMMHRDLKPTNILVLSDDVVKICDLGIATTIRSGEGNSLTWRSDIGTEDYMAPEQNSIYDHRVDIFSMGLILLEMSTVLTSEERSKAFADIRSTNKLTVLRDRPTALDLVMKLTKLKREQRLSIENTLKHPFLSESRSFLSRFL